MVLCIWSCVCGLVYGCICLKVCMFVHTCHTYMSEKTRVEKLCMVTKTLVYVRYVCVYGMWSECVCFVCVCVYIMYV